MVVDYIKEEQPNTLINLSDKINKIILFLLLAVFEFRFC